MLLQAIIEIIFFTKFKPQLISFSKYDAGLECNWTNYFFSHFSSTEIKSCGQWWPLYQYIIFGVLILGFWLLWIELPLPENPANAYAQHSETLDSCFDPTGSHPRCIPWSPSQEIELATTDCRVETPQLSQQSISHSSDANLTSQGNCAAN